MIPLHMQIAFGEFGTKEIPGEKDNQHIVEYLALVGLGHDHDETPWCSAGANWVMKKAGYKTLNNGMAKSWLGWGVPTHSPSFGDVVVLDRPPNPDSGHVTFFICFTNSGNMICYGGNQGNQWSFAEYPVSRVRGYRKPPELVKIA